jgi:hypothetical protein
MAIRGAILANKNVDVPDDSGIVGITAEETVRNLAALGSSMDMVDDKILEIMTAKLTAGLARPAPPSAPGSAGDENTGIPPARSGN